jgi:hypothetical protein
MLLTRSTYSYGSITPDSYISQGKTYGHQAGKKIAEREGKAEMMKNIIAGGLLSGFIAVVLAAVLATAIPTAEAAGITVYKDGAKYVKFGGRVQLQYHSTDVDNGATTDELFFRRLRMYIDTGIMENIGGRIQFDIGKASDDNELAVKDAYIKYTGFKDVTVYLGNKSFPYSREKATSSKKQHLIERTFVGDHNYGTPDRNLGIHIAGSLAGKTITYGAAVASSSIDPSSSKLDFDTPVNKSSDFNEGWIVGGRVDYHPLGYLPFEQGDFKGELKATIGGAAFVWNNDGDNNASPNSVEKVTGYEVSGGVRYMGASVDAEYNFFSSDAIDTTLTSGIYKNGTTDLTNYSIEGGFMVVKDRLEIAAGFQSQDADNYAKEWTRTSVGVNYFVKKHDLKAQLTYRVGKDVDGVDGSDTDEVFVQAQYVF